MCLSFYVPFISTSIHDTYEHTIVKMLGTSSPIHSRSTSNEGVEWQISCICGWMMFIQALIASIVKIHRWITIIITFNGWVFSDHAVDGLKAPCVQLQHRPYIKKYQMGAEGVERKVTPPPFSIWCLLRVPFLSFRSSFLSFCAFTFKPLLVFSWFDP